MLLATRRSMFGDSRERRAVEQPADRICGVPSSPRAASALGDFPCRHTLASPPAAARSAAAARRRGFHRNRTGRQCRLNCQRSPRLNHPAQAGGSPVTPIPSFHPGDPPTMLKLLNSLRHDDYGIIMSTEIVLIGSLLVIGMISGITCLQQAVNCELADLGGAIGALDQSYRFAGLRTNCSRILSCNAFTAGSAFTNCETRATCPLELTGPACVTTVAHRCATPGCCETQPCDSCRSACGQTASRNCGSPCGQTACESCGSACGQIGTGCNRCGTASGCGDCRSGGDTMSGRALGTDVPDFKGTEWPQFSPGPTPPQGVPLQPVPEGVTSPSWPPQAYPYDSAIHSNDLVIPDHVW